MDILSFPGGVVTYDRFLRDLSASIAKILKAEKDDPEFVSQRKAYKMFGRRNVDRWKRLGMVTSYKRPGKVEYRTADLRHLQLTEQDYFTDPPSLSRHGKK